MRVLVHGGAWTTNIGNAFLQLGAVHCIRTVCPNAQIQITSGLPRWFQQRAQLPNANARALDLVGTAKCDLLVLVGMVMDNEFIELMGDSVLAAAKRGTTTVLLGTGACFYDEAEAGTFRRFLQRLRPAGFRSRDRASFDLFHECVDNATIGIDCAFYAPSVVPPISSVLTPYVVATFDTQRETHCLRCRGAPAPRSRDRSARRASRFGSCRRQRPPPALRVAPAHMRPLHRQRRAPRGSCTRPSGRVRRGTCCGRCAPSRCEPARQPGPVQQGTCAPTGSGSTARRQVLCPMREQAHSSLSRPWGVHRQSADQGAFRIPQRREPWCCQGRSLRRRSESPRPGPRPPKQWR